MWKIGSDQEIGNLDNHLAAIDRAKEELSNINADINRAKEVKKDIEDSNHDLLIEKISELEHHRKNIISSQNMINDIGSQHIAHSEALDIEFKKLIDSQAKLDSDKISFLNDIQNKNNEISSREDSIVKSLEEIKLRKESLDSQYSDNEKLLNKIIQEKSFNQTVLNEIIEEKIATSKKVDEANIKVEEWRLLKKECEETNDKANAKFIEASKALEESRINKKEAEDKLAAVIKENESIRDSIIENKKTTIEATKSQESLQHIIATANQKLAELNELKEAMAKQGE